MNKAIAESAAKAHESLRKMWAAEKPAEAPEIRRYVITVECTEAAFESIKTYLKGFPMRRRGFHEEPIGGDAR